MAPVLWFYYLNDYIGQIRKHLWRGSGLADEGPFFFSVQTVFYFETQAYWSIKRNLKDTIIGYGMV